MAARITASAVDFAAVGAKIPAAQKAVSCHPISIVCLKSLFHPTIVCCPASSEMLHSYSITGLWRLAEQGCHPPEEGELPSRRHARHRLRLLQGQGVDL